MTSASLVGATANPENPEEVEVSRPSDALEAKAAAEGAFTSLLLGLGAVALLVGGVGIANVMVISVIERRSEIGLRRALGATRRHITSQFLTESLLLSAMGGAAGRAARRSSHGRLLDVPGPADGRPRRGRRGRHRRRAGDRRDRRPVPLDARGEALTDRSAPHGVAARSVWVTAWSSTA